MLQLTRSRFARQPRIVPLPSTTLGNQFDEVRRDAQLQADEDAAVNRWALEDRGVVYVLQDADGDTTYVEWVNGYSRAWRALYAESGKTIQVDSFPAWPRRLEDA